MSQFARHIGFMIAIIIALLFGFDALYTKAFKQGVPRSKLQHILKQKNATYDYLFLGSSRTEFHIDCTLIELLTGKSCINYGIAGTTFKDSYSILRLLEARGVKFKNVFVQVDYMYNHTDYSSNFRARLLAHEKEPIVKEVLEEYDVSFADKYIPFYRYLVNDHVIGFREVFNLLRGQRAVLDFENGYKPLTGKGVVKAESLPTAIIETNPSIEAMELIFKEKEMNFYFFVAPICSSVVHNGYINKLKTKISNLHNYRSVYDGRQALFFDCGHLNARGAQEFTRLLTNDLILKPIR
jgi:hypothetical protein